MGTLRLSLRRVYTQLDGNMLSTTLTTPSPPGILYEGLGLYGTRPDGTLVHVADLTGMLLHDAEDVLTGVNLLYMGKLEEKHSEFR